MANGHSVLVLDNVATALECEKLASEAAAAAANERERKGLDGLVRRPAVELLGSEGIALFDSLLLRQMERVRQAAPSLDTHLYGDSLNTSPHTIFHNPRLIWSEGEPAVNVYNAGGMFTPHEDAQSLTCLLNVSASCAYEGGGTAFWSLRDAGFKRKLADTNQPTLLLAPPAGTALIFGGQVTHAAQPLLSGERIVAVASFSPQEFRGIVRPPRDLRLFQAGFFGAAAAGSRSEGGSTCCEGDDGDDDGDADGDGGGVLVGSSGASGGDWAKGLKSGQPSDFRPTLRPPASSHPAEECSLEEMCEALMGPAHSTTPPIQGSAGGAERAGADGALIRLPDVSAQGASAVICALKDVGLPDAAQRSGGHTFSECSQEHDGSSQSLGSLVCAEE